MRSWWLCALLVGCGFTPGRLVGGDAGDGGGGGDDPGDALVLPEGEHWVFETAAEFGATGYAIDAAQIEARGTLTPVGYIYGGLLIYGKNNMQLWAVATPTLDYSASETVKPDGIALWNTEYATNNGPFGNVGVTSTTTFTFWFEGDVYLDANDIVSLNADGAGFVDMRLPTGWAHIESRSAGAAVFPAVTTAGWYPVRLGWGEGTGTGFFDFRRGPSGTAVHFSRERLRAPASKLAGTMRQVFYRQILGGAQTDLGLPVPSLERAAFYTNPFTTALMGAGTTNDWSARWYGQFYAATPGTYTVQADTDDGNQLMFDGVVDSDFWARDTGSSTSQSSVTADLTVGWHDLVLDYNQWSGNRGATVTMTAAPETALVGMMIPEDRLRPVEPRRDRLISQTRKFTAASIPNNAAGPIRTIVFDGFASELVSAIDIDVSISTQHLDQLQFLIQKPGGAQTVVLDHPTGGSFNSHLQFHVTTGVVGGGLPGTWGFQISDNTGGANTSAWDELMVTMHTSAGPGQVATASSWISPVKDAGGVVDVIDVVWAERAPIASEVYVRGCTTADCSDNPSWGVPVGQHGASALGARYLQSRVVLHSDGTVEPELDTLAITYRAP